MKKLYNTLLLVVLILSINTAKSQSSLTGTWTFNTSSTEFQLSLKQTGSQLSGSHCSVQQNGNRIDCVSDDLESSLNGLISNPSLIEINFKSSFSNLSGKATIRRINENSIEWTIIEEPQGEFHIPLSAILTRETVPIYARLEYSNTQTSWNYTQKNEYSDITLRVYTDANCTVPFIPTSDFTVAVRITHRQFDSSTDYSESSWDSEITLSTGQSSFNFGTVGTSCYDYGADYYYYDLWDLSIIPLNGSYIPATSKH